MISQLFIGERLGDQLHAWVQTAVVDNRVARIATCEQHTDSWPKLPHLLCQFAAVYPAWAHYVGEQQINLRIVAQSCQGLRSVRGLDDVVAEFAQDPSRVGPDIIVVLYEE